MPLLVWDVTRQARQCTKKANITQVATYRLGRVDICVIMVICQHALVTFRFSPDINECILEGIILIDDDILVMDLAIV